MADQHGLYPNDSLAAYEYRKHGTCTGLSAHDYFATVRNVRQRLIIPAMLQAPNQPLHLSPGDIEQAFMASNANLHPEQHGRHLQQRRTDGRSLLHRQGPLVLRDLPQGRAAQLPARLDRGRARALNHPAEPAAPGRTAPAAESGAVPINYRHAFHAGNFADVLKHAVLARIFVHLKRKETPFRFIDTHAGAGRYDLRATKRGARRSGARGSRAS